MQPDPAGSSSPQISLREYLEAKIQALDQSGKDFRTAQSAEFKEFKANLTKETREAQANVAAKMEVLNELRRAVETDRSLFIRVDKYESDVKARDGKLESVAASAYAKTDSAERLLSSRVSSLETWQAKSGDLSSTVDKNEARIKAMEDWRNKLLGIGVMIALFAGLVGALLMRLLSGVFGK